MLANVCSEAKEIANIVPASELTDDQYLQAKANDRAEDKELSPDEI